jgi:hypothetical protein
LILMLRPITFCKCGEFTFPQPARPDRDSE